MSRSVTVTTGARLHLGPLSYLPCRGRHFGGVGVMVDEPGCRLEFTEGSQDDVHHDGPASGRVPAYLTRYRQSCTAGDRPPGCRVRVIKETPPHSGLGSGTQLGLAVARGLSTLAGDGDACVRELARRVGRGRRSAVGIYGFEQGGFIVDAGKSGRDELGALACRVPFPGHWRVLLSTPCRDGAGLFGDGEEQAFESLGAMPDRLSERLCRIVVTEMLPAVQASDFDAFSSSVNEYGRLVGEFFAPVQGGTIGHPEADSLITQLKPLGIIGTGQTSWGPTVFAFTPDESVARRAAATLAGGAKTRIVAARNVGAGVEFSPP